MLLLNPEVVSPDIEHFMHHDVDSRYMVCDPLAFCFSEVKLNRVEVITQLGEVPIWAYCLLSNDV